MDTWSNKNPGANARGHVRGHCRRSRPLGSLGSVVGRCQALGTMKEMQSESDHSSKPQMRVFVVHGRDHSLRDELAEFLRNLGTEPIVLEEQPSGGRTLIEKFEHYASASDYAVVLLTPDTLRHALVRSGARHHSLSSARSGVRTDRFHRSPRKGESGTRPPKRGNEAPSGPTIRIRQATIACPKDALAIPTYETKAAAAAQPPTPGKPLTFMPETVERKYPLYLPDDHPDSAPLVYVLHVYRGVARDYISELGLNRVADAHGFAVCYPQGA